MDFMNNQERYQKMELMLTKPLEHYDYYYNFLDPNWKPQSFWGKLFGRK
jgi:hypothetical protein